MVEHLVYTERVGGSSPSPPTGRGLRRSSKITHDIGIAGCGIAGLAAALLLHRQGHRVTLYERFVDPRPLGSGLMIQPTGLAVLDRLGLASNVADRGAPIERLFGLNDHGRVVLDARYADLRSPGVRGVGIHRASLFDVLYTAITEEGIAICTGCEIAGSMLLGAGRCFVFAAGDRSPEHELLVDALGLHSPLIPDSGGWLAYGALWASLSWPSAGVFDSHILEQRYRAARQMVGVIPIGRRTGESAPELAFFWSLRADSLDAWRAAGLQSWKDQVRDLWPECEEVLDQFDSLEQLTFARYAHRTARYPRGDRIIHIGDAWHATSPQLGQGANMGLLDAYALAVALTEYGPLDRKLAHAMRLRQDHVALYQSLTAIFTPLYQSDASWPAWLRDRALAPLSRIGPAGRIQASLVGGLVGAPLATLGLAMPDYVQLLAGRLTIS